MTHPIIAVIGAPNTSSHTLEKAKELANRINNLDEPKPVAKHVLSSATICQYATGRLEELAFQDGGVVRIWNFKEKGVEKYVMCSITPCENALTFFDGKKLTIESYDNHWRLTSIKDDNLELLSETKSKGRYISVEYSKVMRIAKKVMPLEIAKRFKYITPIVPMINPKMRFNLHNRDERQ